MVDSISSMGGSIGMMQGAGMKRPPPQEGNVFQVTDSDADGSVSQAELETLTAGITEVTGTTIDVESALSTYDINGDGGLSGEELFEMMEGLGFSPPEMSSGEEADSAMMGPPPPPAEQALAAYGQNSGDDQISQLLELLQDGDSEEEYTSLDVSG